MPLNTLDTIHCGRTRRIRHNPYLLPVLLPAGTAANAMPMATPTSQLSDSTSQTETTTSNPAHDDSVANHYKTRLCKTFKATGSCRYEGYCRFAHGPEDLRTYAENQRRGLTSERAVRRHQRMCNDGSAVPPH